MLRYGSPRGQRQRSQQGSVSKYQTETRKMSSYIRARRFTPAAINQQNALRAEVAQAMDSLGVRACYSDELPWEAASAARSMLGYYDERGRGIVNFTFRDVTYRVLNPAYEHLHDDNDLYNLPEEDCQGFLTETPRNPFKRKKVRVEY